MSLLETLWRTKYIHNTCFLLLHKHLEEPGITGILLTETTKVRSSTNLPKGPVARMGSGVFNQDSLIPVPLSVPNTSQPLLHELNIWKARCPLPRTFVTLKPEAQMKPCHSYSKSPRQKAVRME